MLAHHRKTHSNPSIRFLAFDEWPAYSIHFECQEWSRASCACFCSCHKMIETRYSGTNYSYKKQARFVLMQNRFWGFFHKQKHCIMLCLVLEPDSRKEENKIMTMPPNVSRPTFMCKTDKTKWREEEEKIPCNLGYFPFGPCCVYTFTVRTSWILQQSSFKVHQRNMVDEWFVWRRAKAPCFAFSRKPNNIRHMTDKRLAYVDAGKRYYK